MILSPSKAWILAALLLAGNALAAGPCKTVDECEILIRQAKDEIAQLQAGPDATATFAVAYVDKANHGLKWSHTIDDKTFTNGCLGDHGQLDSSKCTATTLPNGDRIVGDDSAAAQACIKLGGRLPTIEEYNNLTWDFADWNTITKTFNDMDGLLFWSSSLGPYYNHIARGFIGGYGDADGGNYRDYTLSVRCVGR